MASSTHTIHFSADSGSVEAMLRVIAKHATACADELAALRPSCEVEQAADNTDGGGGA